MMTDTQTPATTLTSSPKDSSAQTIVALATVVSLTVLGVCSFIVMYVCKDQTAIVTAIVAVPSVIAGGLINSLASPTGIASVIGAARKPSSDTQ